MPTTGVYSTVKASEIKVRERARKEFGSIEDLALSIERFGLLHPIVVTRDLTLVAGERRFKALQRLKRDEIPVHFVDELNPFELRALELEENVQRLNMTWLEEANAVFDYHEHRIAGDPDWTLDMTSDSLGMSEFQARMRIVVARAVKQGQDETLPKCENLTTAWNTIRRKTQRDLDDETEIFLTTAKDVAPPAVGEPAPKAPFDPLGIRTAIMDIYNVNFEAWLENELPRIEQKFNVVHCDFPYGIQIEKSGQIANGQWEEEWYDDSSDVFAKLCKTLTDNQDRLLATHAHILFWYPAHKYTEVFQYFSDNGYSVNPVPLIWFKSDSTGILPDPKRGPRRVYETALLLNRGDRHVVNPVNNCIGFPANRHKANHPSEKPYGVVHHFLRMLVDENTVFLDPTCGGGTAVAAAEVLRAKSVTGVEPHSEHARSSRTLLNRVRTGGVL